MPAVRQAQTRSGRLGYVLSGSGPASIILFSGAGVPLQGWRALYPRIERMGRVLAWNRLGVAGSDLPLQPQTGTVIVSALRELLAYIELRPPYVLVAHSLGGLYANLFARLHPMEVAAVLLLEAAHPRDPRVPHDSEPLVARALSRQFAQPARLFRANLLAELGSVGETVQEIESAGPFPAVPLTVITGAKAPPRWLMSGAAAALRRVHQRELARLSPLGRQVTAARSGHFPQVSEPQLVIDALLRLLSRAGYAVSPL